MTEIVRQRPDIQIDVLTEVPEWFFAESLAGEFTYHRFESDIGLVQLSPLKEDLEATVSRLDEVWSDPTRVARVAETLASLGSSIVINDISPLGLAAATSAGLPAVLIENFTWDWIYLNYPDPPAGLRSHSQRLAEIFVSADLRIQTEPVCNRLATAIQVPPVARTPTLDASTVRQRLGVPIDGRMVLVSMGGIPWDYSGFRSVEEFSDSWVVVPGGAREQPERRGRLLLLPFHSSFHHPDLVAAADVVVGKLGYSTVAETSIAGSAIAYVERPQFPESPVLANWVEENMTARCISEQALLDGSWLAQIDDLAAERLTARSSPSGAEMAAAAILEGFPTVFS